MGDYTPIVVFTDDELLLVGDLTHDGGYMDFAQGYARGAGIELVECLYSDNPEYNECTEDILEKMEELGAKAHADEIKEDYIISI